MTNELPPNYPTPEYPPAAQVSPPPSVPVTPYDQPATTQPGPWPPQYEYVGAPRPPRKGFSLARLVLIITSVVAILALGIGGGLLLARNGRTTTPPVAIGATSAPLNQAPGNVTDLQTAFEKVAKTVQPSVVEITSSSSRAQAIGSGEFVTADGYIVTNDHVVHGFSTYKVSLSNGTSLTAQLIGEDAQDDLAVVKVSGSGYAPISFADSSQAQIGEYVLALGSPLGLSQSVTFGNISGLNRTASEAPDGPAGLLTGMIQTTAAINPGNSGGALVDLNGQLVGIPTLELVNDQTGSAANGIGLAIPSNRVKSVAQQLISNGHIVSTGQAFLGVVVADVNQATAAQYNLTVQSGALITDYTTDASGKSPAQAAGIQKGDVIVSINGHDVSDVNALATLMAEQHPGDKISVDIVRGSQHSTVQVTVGERPANAQG